MGVSKTNDFTPWGRELPVSVKIGFLQQIEDYNRKSTIRTAKKAEPIDPAFSKEM